MLANLHQESVRSIDRTHPRIPYRDHNTYERVGERNADNSSRGQLEQIELYTELARCKNGTGCDRDQDHAPKEFFGGVCSSKAGAVPCYVLRIRRGYPRVASGQPRAHVARHRPIRTGKERAPVRGNKCQRQAANGGSDIIE